VFLDEKDRPSPWVPGRTVGTLITLSVEIAPDATVRMETANGQ
jgi:hypothetical protein